jgi:hypothetical protein
VELIEMWHFPSVLPIRYGFGVNPDQRGKVFLAQGSHLAGYFDSRWKGNILASVEEIGRAFSHRFHSFLLSLHSLFI